MNRSSHFLTSALRWIAYALGAIVLLVVAAVGFLGFTSPGARLAAGWIEKLASTPDQVVTINDPSGLLSGHLKAGFISLTDSKGVYAEVRNLTVDWSPLALVNGTFDASNIVADTFRLERLPVASQETEEVRSAFALPVDIKIANLDLPEILIGEALAGQEQRLTLRGSADATNERIALKLAAAQQQQPEANATANLVYNPAGNELKLEAKIAEPKGGVLSKILRLPGEPAVNLAVTGNGPLSDWKGSLTAALDGTERLALTGSHQLAQSGERTVSLLGGGAFSDMMPPVFRPLFEGQTDIDVSAVFDKQNTVRIERGQVSTGALALSASGVVSQVAQNNLKATLTGKNGPIDFRWPLAEGEVRTLINSAHITLVGNANSAIVDTTADIESVALPQGQVQGVMLKAFSSNFDMAQQKGNFAVTLQTATTQLTNADINRAIQGPVKIDATLAVSPSSLTFEPLTLESARLGGSASGTVQLSDFAVTTDLKLFAMPAALPDAVAARFDSTIGASGQLTRTGDGKLSVNGLKLTSDTINADGTVAFDETGLTAALTGSLPNIGKLLSDASGAVNFTANTSGPVDALSIQGTLTSSGAKLAGRTLSDLTVTIDANADPASPQANLTASGALDGQAINVKSNLVSKDGLISIPVLEAQVGENRLNGALTLTADYKPDGNVDFNFPDIGLLAAMAGQKASGDLAGSARINTSGGKTAIALKANGSGIRSAGIVIDKPVADITIADLAALAIKGQVTTARVQSGETEASNLKLAFTQSGPVTVFDLTGRYDDGPLLAKGQIQNANSTLTVRLDALAATPRGIALKLASPSTVVVQNGRARLDNLTIQAGSGSVAVSGAAGDTLDLDVRLRALPASLINTFSPTLGAEGAISGSVDVTGKASAPVVAYDLDWTGAAVAQTKSAGLGAIAISAKGQYANNRVTLDTNLTGAQGLAFRGGGNVGLGNGIPLDLKFNGNVPFALLASILAEQGFTLTGTARVDVAIGGNASAPRVTGTVTSSGGRLVDVRRNLAINNLTTNIALTGTQARISTLSGQLATGGTVSASGTIGIGSGFPADLTVRLGNAVYVDGDVITANVDGTVTLKGPLTASPVLGGRLVINRAAITIPEKLPSSLSDINIKHRNAPARVRAMAAKTKDGKAAATGASGSSGIALDLTVTSPGRLFVRGRGIDAELGGDLTIRGTTSAPAVSGGFSLRRGRIAILGKRLEFSKGEIGFGGNLIPTLDLVASSSAKSTTITVNVSGIANNPAITFNSSPALPQDEILAQLIFNRSLSNLSAFQIAQLASAVSQLAGGGSTSLLEGLRGKLGVDDLDVSTGDDGSATVRAGKYLNDRTYLELEQGSEAGGGKATINLDVGRGVKLKGSAGGNGEGTAGVFYEREY
ncbi:translocation/assembly module TamB [Rhizobium sp. CFBP 8762]|uniref:translocation/assembly module TamB domain-containing protein n=1 Tax=Rhizobium sp. CFBP 8762 TaxID=2775279 RepID=UPI0017861088|nr:translocation/assembly module TamB domain-containing protein [Rhizobium sp. CFBP 8762]MBD8555519.1 translocation/assembly module TamB [Rhizobium sp. CFBP 8762]